MGSALCTLFKQTPVKIMFYGLDAVGKTTLLYRLKLGEVVTTIPTIGFNVEEVDINGRTAVLWDVGLRDKSRPLIRHYTSNTDAVVFMIDSTDRERLTDAVDEFFQFVNEAVQERQIPVLVLANKQDQSEVLSPDEIKKVIYEKGGTTFHMNTVLEVFPTVALTLEGVTPALEWLTSQLALKIAHTSYLSSASVWSKAAMHYPSFFVKNVYLRVAGLFSTVKDDQHETKLSGEIVAGK